MSSWSDIISDTDLRVFEPKAVLFHRCDHSLLVFDTLMRYVGIPLKQKQKYHQQLLWWRWWYWRTNVTMKLLKDLRRIEPHWVPAILLLHRSPPTRMTYCPSRNSTNWVMMIMLKRNMTWLKSFDALWWSRGFEVLDRDLPNGGLLPDGDERSSSERFRVIEARNSLKKWWYSLSAILLLVSSQ